jgi:hypothetical protein
MYGKKSQIAYHISDLNKVEAFKGIDCAWRIDQCIPIKGITPHANCFMFHKRL